MSKFLQAPANFTQLVASPILTEKHIDNGFDDTVQGHLDSKQSENLCDQIRGIHQIVRKVIDVSCHAITKQADLWKNYTQRCYFISFY